MFKRLSEKFPAYKIMHDEMLQECKNTAFAIQYEVLAYTFFVFALFQHDFSDSL